VPACPTGDKIANAARRLLAKEGAEAVTMRRVAVTVGITPMAIFRHYANRAALLNALADEGFEELARRFAGKRFSGDIEKQKSRVLPLSRSVRSTIERLFPAGSRFWTPTFTNRQART
jgi:AcrR family transcriptional regulator